MPTTQAFEGFHDKDGRFFKALAKNQSREWFAAHKKEYEEGWAEPMARLLEGVRERIDPLFPRCDLAASPKVFRIFRDVRFSKDKTPYKTHVAGCISVERKGSAPEVPVAVYLHIGEKEAFAGAGHYMMEPDERARFRAAIADERGEELAAIVKKLEKHGFTLESKDVLKKVPRGFDPDHPRADLLKRNGLVLTFPKMDKELLVSRKIADWLVAQTKHAAPLVEWITFATA